MVRMNFIFIFISSSDTNLLRKKSVKHKIKKRWPKSNQSVSCGLNGILFNLLEINQRTNGPVNAHLISGISTQQWPSKP